MASFLLIAVSISTFFTGRLFAKYTTTGVGIATALVAKYNIIGYSHVVNPDGSIGGFVQEYSGDVLGNKGPFNIHNGTVDDVGMAPRNAAFNNIYILDVNGEPDPSKPANIDQTNLKDNRDSKAAPGTGGVSVLKVVNQGDVTVDIFFDFTGYYDGMGNTEAKVVEVDADGNVIENSYNSNGELIASNNVWYRQKSDVFSVNADFTQRFAVGQTRYYKLYWRWPYDAGNEENDNFLGINSNKYYGTQSFSRLLTYRIDFNATQVD